MAHQQIAAFARLAEENARPTRLIAGQATRLSRTMHDIRHDPVNDELLVTNPFASAILVFRGGADGEEAPIRIIQGPKTRLGSPDRLEVDPVNNEILIADGSGIFVYPRLGNGDVAPIRVIEGSDTLLASEGALAVDTVNNLLVAARDSVPRNATQRSSLKIFNRTAKGNVKPLRMISGPNTGIIRINQLQIVPGKGWIVAAMPGFTDVQTPEGAFVGVWSIHDDGDVPPRWKLSGPISVMIKPRGVALDPKNKALLVADMRLNSVMTFYFPEIF